ncbi:HAD-IIB family hydrolase [Thalassoglobus sp. JC818]|uniref:HAD-IIB family hydrolase n=1 Tax=Thalassoglobus sp. JC818 TaxID=3232136 RepID=UPI0034593D3D
MKSLQNLIVFTDLDGCLLNKSDYSYQDALPALKRLKELHVPLVLCSSKTQSEMRPLAIELELETPITCENGGVVCWNDDEKTVLGADRAEILDVLTSLKSKYTFESFRDLGLSGVMKATDLPEEKAKRALNRFATEPLLWKDSMEKIEAFRNELEGRGLTLTQGGRFWHVAGQTTKGLAMDKVVQRLTPPSSGEWITVAIGDSPIDESMLERAAYPRVIPWPSGEIGIPLSTPRYVVAPLPGAAGWRATVESLLDELSESGHDGSSVRS